MRDADPKRAFFWLGSDRLGQPAGYPHLAIVLAEGLRNLGWVIESDVRAWQSRPGGDYLFPGPTGEADAERQAASDLVVIAEDWFFLGAKRLPARVSGSRSPVVYLDRSDLGAPHLRPVYGPEGREADVILRCHSSRFLRYPGNVRPWAFGLSERILGAARTSAVAIRSGAMWNFRHKSHPHSVRQWAERAVRPALEARFAIADEIDTSDPDHDPYDELMLRQTEGRHFPSYFRRLSGTTLCACYGGWFLLPVRQRETGMPCRVGRGLLRRLAIATPAVAQWDSWRLWEAFASGAAVLHLDFEQHGFLLPGPMPVPMVHYLPVDPGQPRSSLEPILDDPDMVQRIGAAGRQWATEHYGPTAMARRLLTDLGIVPRMLKLARTG